eukprot:scaffold24696_cov101-Phaeocystis_antarctica.AAC.3
MVRSSRCSPPLMAGSPTCPIVRDCALASTAGLFRCITSPPPSCCTSATRSSLHAARRSIFDSNPGTCAHSAARSESERSPRGSHSRQATRSGWPWMFCPQHAHDQWAAPLLHPKSLAPC